MSIEVFKLGEKEKNFSAEEMMAIKEQIEKDVNAYLNGPDEFYKPGTLRDTGKLYMDEFAEEVARRLADPKEVERVSEYIKEVNNPNKTWRPEEPQKR